MAPTEATDKVDKVDKVKQAERKLSGLCVYCGAADTYKGLVTGLLRCMACDKYR